MGSPYWPESTAIDPKPIPLPKLSEDAYKEPGLNHMKKVQVSPTARIYSRRDALGCVGG